ncbi:MULTISPECIES: hypothetical protein [unclassified Agrococcus]|uniref:hypothetical protein n=1 Tax=unclassified Agrococcus TaxID=2615065 RepID=UPI00360AC513
MPRGARHDGALELLATLELVAVPWDAMPEGVDPQADVPWVGHVSPDGGIVRASTPYQTDAPGLVDDRYADRRLPVGSHEHRVIVEVLGTLRISSVAAA